MSYFIDPNISVFALVERMKERNTLINHRRTMSLISYEIENASLMDKVKTRIFSGFQYFSKFLPQVERYTRLGQMSDGVFVFGVADIVPPPIAGVTYIRLTPQMQLAKEWFLVSYGASYISALATEEQTRITDPDHLRQFKGVWTFDVDMVTILHDWLSSLVNAHPLNLERTPSDYASQIRIMSNTMGRMVGRLATEKTPTIAREVDAAVKVSIEPLLTDTNQSS